MSYKIDELFDSVLDILGPPPPQDKRSNVPPWGVDTFDERFADEEDRVQTLDENEYLRRVSERLTGNRNLPDLSSEEKEAAEAGIRCRGFDILAFYKSRRYVDQRPYKGKWGIFYLHQGIQFVAERLAKDHPGYGNPWALAYEFLRAHEWFHYRADLQTLMFEAVTKRHLHAPVRQLFRSRRDDFVEEALANRQAWDWARLPRIGLRDFAYEFMKLQPGAYARFDENRLQLAGEWAANVVDLKTYSGALRPDLAHWVEASPDGLTRKSMCPEYVVTPHSIESWWPAALVPPPVSHITDDDAVTKYLSKKKDQTLASRWVITKDRLLVDRFGNGLNFKPWRKEAPAWSVKVDGGNRAHLMPEGNGIWRAYKIGTHSETGHG
jgi:hypothetical protein